MRIDQWPRLGPRRNLSADSPVGQGGPQTVGNSKICGGFLPTRFLFFTFSEPCIVIHIREKDQQDAHLS